MNKRTFAALIVTAVMSVSAHAATISGSVWYGAGTGSVGGVVNPPPASTPSATFTVTGPANIFNFGVNGNGNGVYNATNFLTSGGDTVQYLSGASGSLSNAEFQFTGSTSLTAGTTYSFFHDDGMMLFLTGNGLNNTQEISSSYGTDSFTVATSGVYSFNLLYAEIDGAPADLMSSNFSVTAAATPEPSSIVMLGSGLLAGAGVIRRRLKV